MSLRARGVRPVLLPVRGIGAASEHEGTGRSGAGIIFGAGGRAVA